MNLKSNKAITLMALIITIILLLILAGVSLSMVLGENGLINKTQASVNKYQESYINEQKVLNIMEEYLHIPANIEKYDGLNIKVGEIAVPNLIISGEYRSISFDSDNTAVVSVDNVTGEVTGRKEGTANITVTVTNFNSTKESKSCTVVVKDYLIGGIINVKGTDCYILGDDGTNLRLLTKDIIGNAKWSSAKSQASSFASNLGGSGRVLTVAEAKQLDVEIRKCSTSYWLYDDLGNRNAGRVTPDGGVSSLDQEWHSIGIRPMVIIAKSKL